MTKLKENPMTETVNVVSVKDVYRLIANFTGNQKFNTKEGREYLHDNDVDVFELVAPLTKLANKVNDREVSRDVDCKVFGSQFGGK